MLKRMLIMLAVVLAFIAIIGFVKFQQIQGAIAANKNFQMPPETVTTVVAKRQDWQATVQAVGSVAPMQGVTLAADLPGVVTKIAFTSGSHVAAGQVLVALDTRQERAQLMSAQAQRDLAKSNRDRSQELINQKAISQSEFDSADALYRQAQGNVDNIEATIDRKTIRAPFAGVAGIRQVNLGQYLNSGDPVVPLQAMDRIFVDFAVPQQQAGELHTGETVTIVADPGAHGTATGKITAINPVADDATRNVRVQATFENRGGALRAGMYVTVLVGLGKASSVVALPVSAINYAPYGNSVFIVEQVKGQDGKEYKGVRQQFVKLGSSRGDQVAVTEGVEPGQEIVTSGVFKLRTGAAVAVNNQVMPGNSPSPKTEDN